MANKKITKKQCLEDALNYCKDKHKELENIVDSLKGHPEDFPKYFEKYVKLGNSWYQEAAFYNGVEVSENNEYKKTDEGALIVKPKLNKNSNRNGYN